MNAGFSFFVDGHNAPSLVRNATRITLEREFDGEVIAESPCYFDPYFRMICVLYVEAGRRTAENPEVVENQLFDNAHVMKIHYNNGCPASESGIRLRVDAD